MDFIKKHIVLAYGFLILIAGILLLGFAGKFFVREIVQSVSFQEGPQNNLDSIFGIDKKAPNWELSDTFGNKLVLSDFFGDPLVLTFWASWNTVSADQIRILDDYSSVTPNQLFKIVAINSQEDKSIVSNFMRRSGYQVQVLLDESGKVGELYDIKTLPATYFIDKGGTVKDVFVGALNQEELLKKAEAIIR